MSDASLPERRRGRPTNSVSVDDDLFRRTVEELGPRRWREGTLTQGNLAGDTHYSRRHFARRYKAIFGIAFPRTKEGKRALFGLCGALAVVYEMLDIASDGKLDLVVRWCAHTLQQLAAATNMGQ